MDYDVIILGSGPAGYVCALKCAQFGLKTACIEKDSTYGGTCLNVGCIPSKALLKSSELYYEMHKEAQKHGISCDNLRYDLAQMMQRKAGIVEKFTKGISYLFKKNRVVGIHGQARFIDPHTLEVKGRKYSAKNIVIATGSSPVTLPFLPVDERKIITSTGALSLSHAPEKFVVIGAGVIGLELGSVYHRLGSSVTCIERLDRILPEFDLSMGKAFQQLLQKQGFIFHLGAEVKQYRDNAIFFVDAAGQEQSIAADAILVSVGRKPCTQGLFLETIGIEVDSRGFILIDRNFRTQHAHIYAIGDVAGPPMLAHKGSKEGEVVAHLLAGKQEKINYLAIPNVVYTHPEIASVGITEEQASEQGLPFQIAQFPFKANSRQATVSDAQEGFVKVIVHRETKRLLGLHILGPSASDMIMEGVIVLENALTIEALLHANHAHPTYSEAIHEAVLALTPQGPLHI